MAQQNNRTPASEIILILIALFLLVIALTGNLSRLIKLGTDWLQNNKTNPEKTDVKTGAGNSKQKAQTQRKVNSVTDTPPMKNPSRIPKDVPQVATSQEDLQTLENGLYPKQNGSAAVGAGVAGITGGILSILGRIAAGLAL